MHGDLVKFVSNDCSEEARPQESSSDADSEGNQTQQAAAKLPHVQATAKPALSKKQKPSAMFRKKMKHAGMYSFDISGLLSWCMSYLA